MSSNVITIDAHYSYYSYNHLIFERKIEHNMKRLRMRDFEEIRSSHEEIKNQC